MRLWAKNYENRLFLAIFGHFRAPTIFKMLVVLTKSQAVVTIQKLSTSYLIYVCKYWPGKRKTSKMGHFGHKKGLNQNFPNLCFLWQFFLSGRTCQNVMRAIHGCSKSKRFFPTSGNRWKTQKTLKNGLLKPFSKKKSMIFL